MMAQSDNNNDPKKYEIHIFFNSTGLQTLYCDDFTNFFGTESLNVYKISQGGSKIKINSLLSKRQLLGDCNSKIMYEATSTNEMIIIEYVESPSYLKMFFRESTIYRIERFDYPFPQYDNMASMVLCSTM